MKFEPVRQIFRPLFGLERRETTTRFLYAILTSALIVTLAIVILRFLTGETLADTTSRLLLVLLAFEILLLFVVKRGHIKLAALALVVGAWLSVTFQLWDARGVHDVAVYSYVLVIFIAALLISWQVAITLAVLSIVAIWSFAIAEAWGLRTANIDNPIDMAADLTAIFSFLVLLLYLVIDTLRHSLDAVRAGEEKFSRIFHLSPMAIIITSLEEGRLLDANEACWRLTGLEREEAIGKTTVELGLWGSHSERAKFVEEIKERKSVYNPAYRIRRKSGDYRTTMAFYELLDFEGKPAVLAIYYDVTEQKNAELALQASEQKYRNFVERSIEGIWLLSFDRPIATSLPAEEQVELIYRNGYIAECNDALAHMYGYDSRTELLGAHVLRLTADEELNEINFQATLKLVRDDYRSIHRETEERTRDGKTVYFLNSAVGVIEDGCLVGLWGTQLDITALKVTEAALRRSEARTRALLDAVPDMIFELRRDGTILQCIISAAGEGPMPVLPPEQFLGKSVREVLPVLADQTLFAIERVLESGRVHAFEYQLSEGKENKTFEARVTRLNADTALAIIRDVSLQKWIQGERENLITELERKNAELERFTYTVSHDLKSPLITIKGFLGFLRDDAKTGNLERLDADIQRISDAADKMQSLLSDLLELSRIGRLVNDAEAVDLNKMTAEVLELLYGRIHEGNIQMSVADNLPIVYGDRPRLFEVLQNLIDNAAKFMGGQPHPCIEIGQQGVSADGAAILFVRDNGMGIDPQYKERIFGLFAKLDPRTEGTGIGLALVKRIIEFHGGTIWVESELGQGATFYFTLPQAAH